MRYIYRDAETAEEIDIKTVSIVELNQEHRVRYVLDTSIGAIIFRHLPLRMKRIIDDARVHIYPHVKEMLAEVERLRPYFDGIPEEDWKEDPKKRIEELYQMLRVTDMYALGVIVAPYVSTMDDVEDIYQRLDPIEREQFLLIIQAMSSITPAEQIDPTALEIAKANGLQIMTEEMMEMLTVSQANYYIKRIEQENERIRQLTHRNERVVR